MLRFSRSSKCFNGLTSYKLRQSLQWYSTKDIGNDKDTPVEPHKDDSLQEINPLKKLWKHIKSWKKDNELDLQEDFTARSLPSRCDILIIGGGGMGSSIAYWLKKRIYKDLQIVVVERDPTYIQSSTCLAVGGIRQQFSVEENIRMSLFGAEFLRNINDYLGVEQEPPINVNYHPYGYLLLASENGAETLIKNSKLQNSLGAKNIVLNAKQLKTRFPWLNTENISAGCYGLENEGWFDPWSLLCAFKRKALSMGVRYVNAEAIGFGTTEDDYSGEVPANFVKKLDRLTIRLPNQEVANIKFAFAVIAAGANSGNVAEMAGIGVGKGILSVPLPVVPRKRYVYCFHCPEGPGLNTPLTVDTSGAFFRRDGLINNYICGIKPPEEEEPPTDNLDVDHTFFDTNVWPILAHRVKAFECLKVKSAWAGYYEYNTFDENGIIGFHPYHTNLLIATGFTGHGIQQAPAVGRAITELLLDGGFTTIDLSRLGFERFISLEPMREVNVI